MPYGAHSQPYDVVIIGGGVTGTSLLYTLARYTNVQSLALIEKYPELARVNSHHSNNAQTLHFGDIETHYSFEKARELQEAAELVAAYVLKHRETLYNRTQKMALAIGQAEVSELADRYEKLKKLFPQLRKIYKEEIAQLEPNIVKDRNPDEAILALYSEDGFAINYSELSKSFARNAQKEQGKFIKVFLNEALEKLQRVEGGYKIRSSKKTIYAKTVVVAAGAYSLVFAKRLGYGRDRGILPVAGSFYISCHKIFNGKVYAMQDPRLPFAAIHGDPDVNNPDETRFGPTAKVLPLLERHDYKTIRGFLRTSVYTVSGVMSLLKVFSDPVNFRFAMKNLLYDVPWIGKRFFLKEIRKLVPSIRLKDVRYGKGIGGIRPQPVNTKTKEMEMGESEIIGDNIIFNITPSPGASACLSSAASSTKRLMYFLKDQYHFSYERFKQELKRDRV
ncbi:MAG: FAD-dependent oxidoreductase [Candidatus Harrisonbacteria bacterium]|nr:FAD-dependent oxidoreductase [Candidatus Harrisonbacteria bacterium]